MTLEREENRRIRTPLRARADVFFAARSQKKIRRRLALPGFIGLAVAIVISGLLTGPIEAQERVSPSLSINIPTLTFTGVPVDAPAGSASGSSGYIDIPWIAEYARGVYSYAVVIASVLAGVMMVVGGFYYLTAGGDASRVQKGKQRITDALVGLFLVFGAFAALSIINPDTTSYDALRIKRVARREFLTDTDIQDTLGSDSPNADYEALATTEPAPDALPPPPEGSGAALPPPTPGAWRTSMEAACGDRRGLSLPTYEERQQRLRSIMQAWHRIGGTQGGAVYVRGGSRNCATSNRDIPYILSSISQTLPAHPELLRYTSGECLEVVRRISALSRNARSGAARDESAAHGSACGTQWKNDYDAMVTSRARAAGMLCGDCMSFTSHLYQYCFNGAGGSVMSAERLSDYRPRGNISTVPNCPGQPDHPSDPSCVRTACPSRGPTQDSRYVFRLATPSDDEVSRAVALLRFGDVMSWQSGTTGHVFMYTGGGGMGFEIMEMGGGGSNDISSSGGETAAANAGIPIRVSGIRTTTSAVSYLQQLARSKRGGGRGGVCIFAWRPLID